MLFPRERTVDYACGGAQSLPCRKVYAEPVLRRWIRQIRHQRRFYYIPRTRFRKSFLERVEMNCLVERYGELKVCVDPVSHAQNQRSEVQVCPFTFAGHGQFFSAFSRTIGGFEYKDAITRQWPVSAIRAGNASRQLGGTASGEKSALLRI